MKTKKIVSMLLSLCILASTMASLAVTASADDSYVCQVGGTKYETVLEAVLAAEDGVETTITLIADDVEKVYIPKEKVINLDLNGFILKEDSESKVKYDTTDIRSAIENWGKLTICDSNCNSNAPIVRYFTDSLCSHGVEVGTACADCESGIAKADSNYDTCTTTKPQDMTDVITVTGGCIQGSTLSCIEGHTKGEITLNSGNIIGFNEYGVKCYFGNFLMNGGRITGGINSGIQSESANVTINSGCIDNCGGITTNEGTLTITGGTITNTLGISVFGGNFVMTGGEITENTVGAIIISEEAYIGGSAKIYNNNDMGSVNLGLFAPITLGTSTDGTDGNKVLKPTEEMKIGVGMLDIFALFDNGEFEFTDGIFATNAVAEYVDNFFADKSDYGVRYTSEDGGCLELTLDPVFNNSYDSGYYAKTADGEDKSGIIAFTSQLVNIEGYKDATEVGYYFYNSGDVKKDEVKVEITKDTATDLNELEGWFYGFVKDIAVGDFAKTVVAKPYIKVGADYKFGDSVTGRVNAEKWLGIGE